MQFNTKRGLVDIPNEEIIAAARTLGLSAVPPPDQQGHCERSRLAAGWAPIESAPKDGTHILACNDTTPYGPHWGFNQRPPMVVHYWSNPGEEGFYLSHNSGQDGPAALTHWHPLPTPPSPNHTISHTEK